VRFNSYSLTGVFLASVAFEGYRLAQAFESPGLDFDFVFGAVQGFFGLLDHLVREVVVLGV